jgi:TolA-binding protein
MGRINIRYGNRRKKKTLNKTNIMTRTKAKSQARQINALASKIKTLEKKQKQTRQYCQFRKEIDNRSLDFQTNSGWSVENLVDPDDWIGIFQANNEVENSNKITVRSMTCEFYFRITDSKLPCTPKIITCFLVKLRKETGVQTLNDTGQMSTAGFGTAANQSVLWETVGIGTSELTLAKVNPAAFEVVKVKKFQIQNIVEETAVTDLDTDLTTAAGTYRRFTWKLKMGNLIKANANKKWSEMSSDQVAIKDRLYLLVHMGGSGSLLTPELGNGVSMSANCTFQCRGTN